MQLKDALNSEGVKRRLNDILKDRAPQFAASLVQIQAHSYQLQKCDANSIIGAAITAAALDLSIDPNLGEAHLVPYKQTCTFQLGYIGLSQLAMRSGQYKRLGWMVIHDGQLESYNELTGELVLNHKTEGGEVIGYAAQFTLLNGFEKAIYWTKERCQMHAEKYSEAYLVGVKDPNKRFSPWWDDFDKMALKTVLKSLLRTWGPKSVQMRMAVIQDGAAIDITGNVQAFPDEPGLAQDENKGEDKPTIAPASVEILPPAGQKLEPPKPLSGPLTETDPRKKIENVCAENSITFDEFKAFAEGIGVPGAADWGSAMDIPAKTAATILKTEFVKPIKEARGE